MPGRDEERVAALQAGQLHFYEPDLEDLLAKGIVRLRFATELMPTVRDADVLFIAVDTPQG